MFNVKYLSIFLVLFISYALTDHIKNYNGFNHEYQDHEHFHHQEFEELNEQENEDRKEFDKEFEESEHFDEDNEDPLEENIDDSMYDDSKDIEYYQNLREDQDVDYYSDGEIKEEDQIDDSVFQTCLTMRDINNEKEYKNLLRKNNPKALCVESCVLQTLGIIDDEGNYDLERDLEIVEQDYSETGKQEEKKTMVNIIMECYEENIKDKSYEDYCEMARVLQDCKLTKKINNGLASPPAN